MADVTVERRGEGVHLRIVGGLDPFQRPSLLEILDALVHDRRTPIVIDLSRLEYWGAAERTALVAAHERARRYRGHVILLGPSKAIRKSLEVTGLDRMLWILDDERDIPSDSTLEEAWAQRSSTVASTPAPSRPVEPDGDAVARMGELSESFRDRYVLERRLGSGGFGEVFVAEQRDLGRKVAVKLIPLEALGAPGDLELVRREGLALAALADRNVLSVIEAVTAGRYYCLVTELAKSSLREHLDRAWANVLARPALSELRDMAVEVTGGLGAAHERDILHRDVKPENVLVFLQRRRYTFKLADFGLACRDLYPGPSGTPAARPGDLLHTWSHGLRGTPLYLAPEIWRGAPHSRLSDVFALGVVLYEAFAGRHPFPGATLGALRDAITRHVPGPLSLGHLPRELEDLVARMLAKEPRDRPFCDAVLTTLKSLSIPAGGVAGSA